MRWFPGFFERIAKVVRVIVVKSVSPVPPENLIPTRYSLLSRLQDWDDQESWKDFFDTYWRLIYAVATKSGLSEAEAQDVVQETVISVAKGIHTFKRDRSLGSFKGWLRNLTRWRITDQMRKRMPGHAGSETASSKERRVGLEQIPDPHSEALESVWEEEWRSNLYEAAVQRVKDQVKEEHYQIFYLYVIKEWPAARVARAYKITSAQVYLTKHRIAALIKKEIQILERKSF
jgi:RNA polymerase sigma factor (sigma-70 family)